MKTALALGGGALALYIGYKLFLEPKPATATAPGSATSLAASTMTLNAARNTVVGGFATARGFLASLAPRTAASPGAPTNTWSHTLRNVLTATRAPVEPAPAPSGDMYTVTGVRGVGGSGVSGQAFPANPGAPGRPGCDCGRLPPSLCGCA